MQGFPVKGCDARIRFGNSGRDLRNSGPGEDDRKEDDFFFDG